MKHDDEKRRFCARKPLASAIRGGAFFVIIGLILIVVGIIISSLRTHPDQFRIPGQITSTQLATNVSNDKMQQDKKLTKGDTR